MRMKAILTGLGTDNGPEKLNEVKYGNNRKINTSIDMVSVIKFDRLSCFENRPLCDVQMLR